MSSAKKSTNDYLKKRYAELKQEYARDWKSHSKQIALERKFVKNILKSLRATGVDLGVTMSVFGSALKKGEQISKQRTSSKSGRKKKSRRSSR